MEGEVAAAEDFNASTQASSRAMQRSILMSHDPRMQQSDPGSSPWPADTPKEVTIEL